MKKLKSKNSISEENIINSNPVGSIPETLYGSAEVHKPFKNGLAPFRPIPLAIDTPTYKLGNCLVSVLSK